MTRESFYPYPPRPGIACKEQSLSAINPHDMLSKEMARQVIDFENQLYNGQLDNYIPSAASSQKAQAESVETLPRFESIWQKKANNTTLGVSYFMTDQGREALLKATDIELRATNEEDCLVELSALDIRNLSSEVIDKLGADSVGFEEEKLTKAFIEGGFDGAAIPEPQFLTIYKNPEVILEKAQGYRQLKIFLTKVLNDLNSESNQENPQTKSAKILLATLYRRRLNYFIAGTYVQAYQFAYQARMSGRSDYQDLVNQLEESLPAFSQLSASQTARFLVRMDRYRYGVSVDEDGKFTWLSQEARAEADLAGQEIDRNPVNRGIYADIDPTALDNTKVEGSVFGEFLSDVLREYGLLSKYSAWDSERQTPAPDGKWQVIVNKLFKSLAVDDKQRIMKVPDEPASLMRILSVGSHEITHVLQNHNKLLIGRLAIMERIGLDSISEQTESGGLWQEREARQRLTGQIDNDVSGTGYLKVLTAKAQGLPFGKGVRLYYEDLLRRNPTMAHEKAAAQAVNRTRRAYRSGGFEYARNLAVLTNSQSLRYLEQGLIYKSLTAEQLKLLFIGGVSTKNLLELSAVGLVDINQMYIPKKMPWEIMHKKAKGILTAERD